MLLSRPDGLDHHRFALRCGAQFLPGEIAPVERHAIRKLHRSHPLAAQPLSGSGVLELWRRLFARGFRRLLAHADAVLWQPVRAVQPLALVVAEGERLAVDFDHPDPPRHQSTTERTMRHSGIVPGALDL